DTEEVPKKKRQEIEADSSFVAIVTASNIRRDTMYLPKKFAASNGLKSKFKIDLMNEKGESWTIELRHEPYSGRFLIRSGWRSFCVANGKKPGDMFNFKLIRNVETPVLKLFPLNLPKLETQNQTEVGFCLSVEPSNDTRQGLEATEKEFLGVQTNRDDSRQEPTNEAIRKGKWLEANETTIKEENITTSENRFVTLILTTSKLDLPLEFTKGNGIKNAEKIKMIDRYGTTWSTSLLMDKKKRGAMKLGKGCIRFCEVNGVKMGESFVLELVWEDTVPLKVQIQLLNYSFILSKPPEIVKASNVYQRSCMAVSPNLPFPFRLFAIGEEPLGIGTGHVSAGRSGCGAHVAVTASPAGGGAVVAALAKEEKKDEPT
ncbi:hypothetical protein F2Q70_00041358, partial [Brassica cretica]